MPGLRLTEAQVRRLCGADAAASAAALHALVSAGFLKALGDGTYGRADIVAAAPPADASRTSSAPPIWRRILCPVDFARASGKALSAGSLAALQYATTLAVAHRARVTALHVAGQLPLRMAFSAGEVAQVVEEQQHFVALLTDQLRRIIDGGALRGLIDVHVAVGSTHPEIVRTATEITADLIVLGRGSHGGTVSLAQLRDVWHRAPCPVLIVHPSGHAAVA